MHKLVTLVVAFVALGATASIAQPPPPPAAPPPLTAPPVPPGNPLTESKANLGKVLFWDEQLSSTRTVACGTCHIPAHGGDDPRSVIGDPASLHPGADGTFGTADDVVGSPGVPASMVDGTYLEDGVFGFAATQVTGRRARSMIDAAFSPTLFWDGRATGTFVDPVSGATVLANGAALESQVLGPPLSSVEMGHFDRDWTQVADRVAGAAPLALSPWMPSDLESWLAERSYAELFDEAFGSPDVTPARIAMAIATYERTLYSDQTPFDADLAGGDELTAQERAGRNVFTGPGRCAGCHAGSLLSDDRFHYIGVRPAAEDPGRFAETGNPADLGAMRTPSLRNVALRPPYMHDGRFATLADVVDFYDRGGDFPASNNPLRPLGLTAQQKANLVAFLERPLTDPRVVAEQAPFDRPILYTESDRVPQIVDTGSLGTGGFEPVMVAIEPPLLGNPNFTVAVIGALGGAEAVLVLDAQLPDPGSLPSAGSVFSFVAVTLDGSGAGAGSGSVAIDLPADPALAGTDLYGRWYVNDPAAGGGFAVSPAFRATLFGATCAAGEAVVDGTCVAVDHLVGFKARAGRTDAGGSPLPDRGELADPWVVHLDDTVIDDGAGDDPENFEVERVEGFLHPASGMADVEAADPTQHFVRYRLKNARESAAPAVDGRFARPLSHVERQWSLENAFGSVEVTTRRARGLLVETMVSASAAPSAPTDARAYL